MSGDSSRVAQDVRAHAGLFVHDDRVLVEVAGGDRVRWLQGQVSNDVAALAPGQGCYATLLTVKGRIVADLHVLAREDRFWLETGAAARDAVRQRLERYIVADDVTLVDATGAWARLALEGPATARILAAAAGGLALPASEAAVDARIGGADAVVWAFGATGLPACQLFVPTDAAGAVREALLAAGRAQGLVEADRPVLEILRVESGVPALGAELDEEVFPAEARLARAISITKGCYTGQEIVERIRSRGQVNHLLVGLRFAGELPALGCELHDAAGKRVGEVTSAVRSAAAGAIGLGYVRREYETDGTELASAAGPVRVAALPFVPPTGPGERAA